MSPVLLLIAVVDDDAFVCKALQRLLRSAGFAVETYSSGSDFLEAIRSHTPDCVVLDLHMPEVNGFEVQAQLARAGSRIPAVVITGHDTPESRARAMRNGASAYICKPVDDLALLEAINAATSAREPGSFGRERPGQ
jgi:FixJ family two-component response regulator